MASKSIGMIIGSVRENRIGPQVADFIKSSLIPLQPAQKPPTLNLIDIRKFNLPIFDEPHMPATVPAQNKFVHQHTIDWNAEIESHDAYIIITPEYNFGIPGATKNAIDYLYHSWIGKPVMIISYGIMGGETASAGLKATLEIMHLKVVETRPAFSFPDRDPEQHNMSPGLAGSFVGKLVDSVVEDWKQKTDDLAKGYKELLTKMEETS